MTAHAVISVAAVLIQNGWRSWLEHPERCVQPGGVAYIKPLNGLWCYHIDAERPIQGGALSNGGNLFEWMTNSLQLPEPKELEKELAAMEPDAHGLTILPFFCRATQSLIGMPKAQR